jgi:hypothetical protein
MKSPVPDKWQQLMVPQRTAQLPPPNDHHGQHNGDGHHCEVAGKSATGWQPWVCEKRETNLKRVKNINQGWDSAADGHSGRRSRERPVQQNVRLA